MIDLNKACRFVEMRGNKLEKERLRSLLTGERGDPQVFPVERLQNSDYGFPLRLRRGEPSSINSTAVARLCLQDLNLLTSAMDRQMARFILSCRNRDGIFVDPYPTLEAHLPVWMEFGTFRFAVYYTLFSCLELLKIDLMYARELEPTLIMLQQWQRSDGSIPGYLHNSWFGAGVLLILGESLERTERILEFLDRVPFAQWEASQLIWAMEVLIDGGLEQGNRLIQKWLQWLEWMQNPNGSFTSEDEDRFNPDVTLHALRVLKKLNLIGKG